MTKTLEINGREAKLMMDGLLAIAYEANKKIEEYEILIIEKEDFEGGNADLLKVWRQQQIRVKETAYRAYDKIKALGLVF